MKCELCHQADAVTVIWKKEAGVKRELYVCAACAARSTSRRKRAEDLPGLPDEDNAFFPKELIIRPFHTPGRGGGGGGKIPDCPHCGTSLDSVLTSGIIGCPECYSHFYKNRRFREFFDKIYYASALEPRKHWSSTVLGEEDFENLSRQSGSQDVLLQSSAFLFRNVSGWAFPHTCSPKKNKSVSREIAEKLLSQYPALYLKDFSKIHYSEALIYRERQIVGDSFLEPMFAAKMLEDRQSLPDGFPYAQILINGESHFRIQASSIQFDLPRLFARVQDWSRKCEKIFKYASDPHYGYLTSNLYSVGTAFRLESLMHLPALTLLGEMRQVLWGLNRIHQVAAPIDPFSNEFIGAYYRIRNRQTLWTDEKRIMEHHRGAICELVKLERQARERLKHNLMILSEDRYSRALAVLDAAKLMPANEMISLLSDIRMGAELGFCDIDPLSLDRLLFEMLPGSLSWRNHASKSGLDLDQMRANELRVFFSDFLNKA